jgi:S1-C subfamily serine protease
VISDPNYYKQIVADCLAWVDGVGTGFFIDSDLLLTCTHVIEGKTTVTVKPFGSSGMLQATVLPGALPKDDGDLALLQVTDPDPKQYAVLLHVLGPAEFAGSRDVVLAGFPKDDFQHAGGYEPAPASVHPRWADRTTLAGLIVETTADVAKGLSGAPVLDLATGTIIGITRYRKAAAGDPGGGGGAIPVALAVQAFPQVRAAYDRPPEAAKRWLERDQYELRAIGREPKGTTGRLDLHLSGKLDQWSVRVDDENGSQSEVIRLDALGGVNVTRAVFQWTRGHRTPSSDDLQLVGDILSAALMHGRVGELYRNWRAAADELTVRLIADPACELADLPWEYAQPSKAGDRSLGLDQKLALARVLPGAGAPTPPAEPGSSASVIALIVQPDPESFSYPTVITTEHDVILWPSVARLEENIDKVVTSPLVLRPVITNPSRTRLEQLNGTCDVLHYQGFARITPTATQLFLYSETTTRKLTGVNIADIAGVAGRLRAKVVVIEAHAAPASEFSLDDPALRIAAPFLDAGVVAVVTTRFPVHPDQALLFNQEFYKCLGAGMTVERAAQAGRLSLSFDNTLPDPAAYGAFVVWTADVPGFRVALPPAPDGDGEPPSPPGWARGLAAPPARTSPGTPKGTP